MTNEVLELDFTDAPPAQGGGFGDKVPQGSYRCRVTKAEVSEKDNGQKNVRVQLEIVKGDYTGKKVNDFFPIPRPGTDDKKFGLQRFHAMLIALEFKEQSGKAKLPIAKIVGRECTVEIEDNTIPAKMNDDGSQQYGERVVSRPATYFSLRTPANGATPTAAPAQAAAPAPEPEAPAQIEAAAAAAEDEGDMSVSDADELFD